MAEFVIPRPGKPVGTAPAPIPAPKEADFTKTFGQLLPAAAFVNTSVGKAAYYEFPPSVSNNDFPGPHHVLFIHGVQTPGLGMLPLLKALQSSFPNTHMAIVDLWGHGLSDTPVKPHEASLFHELLDAVLDQLHWPQAHLVGFSFGGALTTGYVASRPSRVKSYTLIAPAGLIQSAQFTAQEQNYLSIHCDNEKRAQEWVLEFLEGGELVVPSDWKERVAKGEVVAEALREWQMREHRGHVASVVAIVRDGGVMDNEASFVEAVKTGIPALVVLGELDDLCTEGELREIGFRHVVVVPGVGHGVVRERVPEAAAHVSAFWKTLK